MGFSGRLYFATWKRRYRNFRASILPVDLSNMQDMIVIKKDPVYPAEAKDDNNKAAVYLPV
jgi:hypothetical protein